MQGLVVQINASRGGVPKHPIESATVGPLGLTVDSVTHPQIHGGPRQALLLICSESIEHLQALGYPVFFGALGENLTTRGLDRTLIRIGQRYRVGTALIEITKLRVPCKTLDVYGPAIKAELYDKAAHSPCWGVGGFYASVVEPGEIRTGDSIALEDSRAAA